MAHFNLYCTENAWEDEEDDYQNESLSQHPRSFRSQDSFCVSFSDDQIYWEQDELISLFLKEKTQGNLISPNYPESLRNNHLLAPARKESVERLLSVSTHLGFNGQTTVLAVSYLDLFLSMQQPQIEKPWVPQLAAVTCLSLAAKVEETRVPFLLDLQVGTKYIFEPKTIKRMELLVLSALEWRMHQVTPLSFIDHIVRRLAVFSTSQHLGFFRTCEHLLLCLISDSRLGHFKPSIVASATMIHVINELDRFNAMEYEQELLCIMGLKKDEVKDCIELIEDLVMVGIAQKSTPLSSLLGSPAGVLDVVSFVSDNSDDSRVSSSSSTTVEEEELQEKGTKKRRLDDPPHTCFSPLDQIVVDIILGSP